MVKIRRILARLVPPKSDPDAVFAEAEASLDSHRRTLADLDARQSNLDRELRQLDQELISHIDSGDKIRALQVMKRKRIILAEIQKIGNDKLKLDAVMFRIHSAISSKIALEALKDLSAKHANLLRTASPAKIEKLMDTIAEQDCIQTHIESLMDVESSVIPSDELLEAELIHLEDKHIHDKIAQIEAAPITPSNYKVVCEDLTTTDHSAELFDELEAETIAQFQGALVL